MTQCEEIALKAFCKIKAPLLPKFTNSEATKLNPQGIVGILPRFSISYSLLCFLTPFSVGVAFKSNVTLLRFSDQSMPLFPFCFSVNIQAYVFPLKIHRGQFVVKRSLTENTCHNYMRPEHFSLHKADGDFFFKRNSGLRFCLSASESDVK